MEHLGKDQQNLRKDMMLYLVFDVIAFLRQTTNHKINLDKIRDRTLSMQKGGGGGGCWDPKSFCMGH